MDVVAARRHTDLARENARRLDGCANHAFKQVEEAPRLVLNYRCASCGGVIDWIAYRWYVTGRRHEQEALRAHS